MSEAGDASEQHVSERVARELLARLRQRVMHPPAALVGRLATLIGDEPIRYVSSRFEGSAKLTGEIVVFTDEHVFHQAQQHDQTGDLAVEIAVAARSSLRSLTSSGHEDARRDPFKPFDGMWPWPMPVKFVYDEIPSFTLPLSLELYGEEAAGLMDLLPSLTKDLNA